ncbi:hypothetical protein [Phycicoccus flavus]|uniref:hypothetical protein n=1 Tax=Phycicoccus flavus TaxID=2502783 RepID=UPI000FEB79F0|nr:hypothetical protein [Phycicoccus flavus]NHA68981.1 hypothetical protein [Phycicoccus flavus]
MSDPDEGRGDDRYDVADDGERLVVRVRLPRLYRWLVAAVVLLALVQVVGGLIGDGSPDPRLLAFPVLLGGLQVVAWWQLRREYVADAFGLDEPRRGRRLGWAEVAHVEKPGPFHDTVTVGLAEGGTQRTMFPSRLASRIAEIGRVPLR